MKSIVKLAKWVARLVIFSLFIYLVYTSFEWGEFISAGNQFVANPLIILFIFISYYLSFYLKAIAWRLFFKSKVQLSSTIYGIFYSLFINHILPFKVGDVIRSMVLTSREKGITTEQAFHSVFIMRILDIGCLAIVAGIGAVYYQTALSIPNYFILFPLIIGVFSTILVRKWFPVFFNRNVQFLLGAFSGLNGLFIVLLVFISWILEGAVLLGVALIIMKPVAPLDAIWANSVTIIGQMFQFTPGGITTYEAIMTYALTFVGISTSDGLLIAIYSHAFKFIFSYLVGFYVLLRYPITIKTMKKWLQFKGVKRYEKRV